MIETKVLFHIKLVVSYLVNRLQLKDVEFNPDAHSILSLCEEWRRMGWVSGSEDGKYSASQRIRNVYTLQWIVATQPVTWMKSENININLSVALFYLYTFGTGFLEVFDCLQAGQNGIEWWMHPPILKPLRNANPKHLKSEVALLVDKVFEIHKTGGNLFPS